MKMCILVKSDLSKVYEVCFDCIKKLVIIFFLEYTVQIHLINHV